MKDTKELMDELELAFMTATTHPNFTNDAKAIQNAIDALQIPDPEARFRKQFRSVALRNLLAKAKADESGQVKYPTDEDISVEVDRLLANWRAKTASK